MRTGIILLFITALLAVLLLYSTLTERYIYYSDDDLRGTQIKFLGNFSQINGTGIDINMTKGFEDIEALKQLSEELNDSAEEKAIDNQQEFTCLVTKDNASSCAN